MGYLGMLPSLIGCFERLHSPENAREEQVYDV